MKTEKKKENWMSLLASHFENSHYLHSDEKLVIVFDIDGTILDMRYMIRNILAAYDRLHHTHYFKDLQISQIKVHENQVDRLLSEMHIALDQQNDILEWYRQNRWMEASILNAHRPFKGVLEVIRWFQLQPNTFVGLNTGRPESVRTETLISLNQLGKSHKVEFSDSLLQMNPYGWDQSVKEAKVDGIRKFQENGYRVFAVVDNEPENLKEIAKIDPEEEIFLLHADTIFESKRVRLPYNAIKGSRYDLTELIDKKSLPKHIQFVWHGVNDEINLRQFLSSDITWGECDVRMSPDGDDIILRHDHIDTTPRMKDEEWLHIDSFVNRLSKTEKSLKFDFKEGGMVIDRLLELVDYYKLDASRLWFHGDVEKVQQQGFKTLAITYPKAILQMPIEFLVPFALSTPEKAKDILDMYRSWGVNRFAMNWHTENMLPFFDQMDEWGFEVNIYNVNNLEEFLEAVLLEPSSITSDFNFPKWHYYGRGSGEAGNHYEYMVKMD